LNKTIWLYGTASSPNGATITAWDDGKTIGSAVVANNAYKTPDYEIAMSDDEIDSARITSNGYRTLIIKNIPIPTGGQQLEFNIEQAAYQHSLTITLISSEAGEGHLVRDSPIILTNSEGTKTLNTSAQTVTYHWTSEHETETITYDINPTGTGHQDVAAKQTSVGASKSIDETLVANDFSGDITYTIKDQNSQNVSGANVSASQGKSGTTNTSGNVTLTAFTIAENNYSEPVSTAISHTVSKEGYLTKNGSANINTGTNNVNETIEEVVNNYQHNLTITLISSEAGEGHLVRDSPIILTNSEGTRTLNTSGQTITYNWTSTQATENITYDINVSGSGHQDVPAKSVSVGTALTENRTLTANDWAGDITYNIKDQNSQNVSGALVATSQSKSGTTNTSGNVTLLNYIITENTFSEPLATSISHTVSKTGYTTKNGSANINTGANNVNETIEEIAANSFSESVVFADQTADEYDNGLVFIIKTLNDGQEHAYNVTDAQHVQNITLTGDYDTSTPIELYYTTTSATAQGKEAKILTVVRSRKQPTASNGSRTTTLTTTINDLFTPSISGDTAWVLSLDTDMYNDVSFRTHVNGGKEWVYSSGGNRAMNIYGLTRSLDLSAGTYADDLTPEEKQAIRDRAALFDQDFWNRGTGLVILNANFIESANYNTSAGSINIFYDRTEQQPGNTHYQVSTTRANTYDHGIGFVPRGTVMYLGQLTGETIQAVDWIFDDTSGGILGVYNHDQNGNPYLEREDDLVVNMTYVGGKAPKNE